MKILSDATFKGNVSINGGAFFVTPNGYVNPLIETTTGSNNCCFFAVNGSEFVNGDLFVNSGLFVSGGGRIELNSSGSINYWSDLNNILDFAPKSLSTTVNSNTTKIDSACSTISSLCTKVNSLCTKVDGIQSYTKYALGNPQLPVGCTKFYFVDNFRNATTHYSGCKADLYKIIQINQDMSPPSSIHVFKGGLGGPHEEVQMDVKQYNSGNNRWFEGTLASNTTGYGASEFIITFDEFEQMCTTATVPQ